MYSYNYDSYYSSSPMEDFFDSFFSSGDAAIMGIFLTTFLIIMAIALVISVVMYICSAFPLYKLAKKLDRPYAWLAWIPIVGMYCREYVLCDLAGDKELVIIKDKIVIKNRKNSFWIFLGISVLGSIIVGVAAGILSLIPIIGPILCIPLALVPAVCVGFMDYAYLRDALDLFKEDKQSNNTTSIIVTVLDCFVSGGIAKIVVLFTLLNKEPLPQNFVNCESAPVYETPAYAQPSYEAPTYQVPNYEAHVADTNQTYTDDNNQQ